MDSVFADIKRTSDSLETLAKTRDLSYRGFVVESIQSFSPAAALIDQGASVDIDEKDKESVEKSHITATNTQGETGFSATAASSHVESQAEAKPSILTPLRTVGIRRDSYADATQAASQAASSASAAASSAASSASAAATSASGWVSSKFSGNTGNIRH